MIGNDFSALCTLIVKSLPVELPQVGLTLFHLYGVVLKQAHLQVLFVHFDSETVSHVLYGKILTDGTELTDNKLVGDSLLVLTLEVVKRFS